jgi:hypothetical protein
MRIKINDKVQSNDTPLIVMSKYLIDTENKLKYDLQGYSNIFSSDYNVLLVDNTSNVVKGIIRIDRLAAPQRSLHIIANRQLFESARYNSIGNHTY